MFKTCILCAQVASFQKPRLYIHINTHTHTHAQREESTFKVFPSSQHYFLIMKKIEASLNIYDYQQRNDSLIYTTFGLERSKQVSVNSLEAMSLNRGEERRLWFTFSRKYHYSPIQESKSNTYENTDTFSRHTDKRKNKIRLGMVLPTYHPSPPEADPGGIELEARLSYQARLFHK